MSHKYVRTYAFERDSEGKVCTMIWTGDRIKPTKEELERQKLEEHERIYGKRES